MKYYTFKNGPFTLRVPGKMINDLFLRYRRFYKLGRVCLHDETKWWWASWKCKTCVEKK